MEAPVRPALRALLRLTAIAAVGMAACGGGSSRSFSDQLMVVRDTGLYVLSLSSGEEEPFMLDPPDALLADPAVSPDGRLIAHARLLQGTGGPEPDFGADLYVAGRDGEDPRLVFEHRFRGEQVRTPAWFPSGEALLFSAQRFDDTRGFIMELHRLDLATGESELVVEGAVQPAVSPDGSMIAFVRVEPDGLQSLWVADADGSDPRQIAAEEESLGVFISPSFSPDGRLLAFGVAEPFGASVRLGDGAPDHLAARDGVAAAPGQRPSAYAYNGFPTDIWVVDLERNETVSVADLNFDQPSVAWSGDGERLFVLAANGLFFIDPSSGDSQQVGEGTFHGQLDWLGVEAAQET